MIKSILEAILRAFRSAFLKNPPEPEQLPTPNAEEKKTQSAVVVKKSAPDNVDEFGAHYYLGDLLDNMDVNLEHMKKLKKFDRDAYDMFSRVGATIVSSKTKMSRKLEPSILKKLPSVGAFMTGRASDDKDDTSEVVHMRLGYFCKLDQAPDGGTKYRVVMTYQLDGRVEGGEFLASVHHDGQIYAAREVHTSKYTVGRGSKKPCRARVTFARKEIGYSPFLVDLAKEKNETPHSAASAILTWLLNGVSTRESGLTVTVKKGRAKAVFAIDMLRTPYFFKDRKKTVTENGKTKPIFHIVRGFRRSDGSWVKTHFRGVREFEWNGYDVKIGLVGKHGVGLMGFDVAGHEFDGDAPPDMLTFEETGKKLSRALA